MRLFGLLLLGSIVTAAPIWEYLTRVAKQIGGIVVEKAPSLENKLGVTAVQATVQHTNPEIVENGIHAIAKPATVVKTMQEVAPSANLKNEIQIIEKSTSPEAMMDQVEKKGLRKYFRNPFKVVPKHPEPLPVDEAARAKAIRNELISTGIWSGIGGAIVGGVVAGEIKKDDSEA